MFRTISILFISLLISPALRAQWLADGDVISALSLHANRSNVKVSTTLGEAIIFSRTDGSVNVLQGFQRDRTTLLTQVYDVQSPEIQVTVYPNPCQQEFRVESAAPLQNLKCYALDGRLMAHWPVVEERYFISHLPKGIYILSAQLQAQEITIQTLIIQ